MEKKNTTEMKKDARGECRFCMCPLLHGHCEINNQELSFGQVIGTTTTKFCSKACQGSWARQEMRIDMERDLTAECNFSSEDYKGAVKTLAGLNKSKLPPTAKEKECRYVCEFTAAVYLSNRLENAFLKACLSRSETKAELNKRRLKVKEKYGELLELAMTNQTTADVSSQIKWISNACVCFANENMGQISAFAK
jgi:hypothetical protein